MVRDQVFFHFKGGEQTLRAYIEQVFATAKFFQRAVKEQELVDRELKNFNPSVLRHAAFIDRPSFLRVLYQVVGTIEEELSVARERGRIQPPGAKPRNYGSVPWTGSGRVGAPPKCWDCGGTGHLRRDCLRSDRGRETGRHPEAGRSPEEPA
jgi:hypothetical protein